MNVLDLFSGIGGFSLGLHRAGMTTVAFCECEPYPQKVLKKNFLGVPIYDDVRTLTADRLTADGITGIDVICGGFPCQPWSDAGEQRGADDHRHLWPEMLRLIQEVRPAWVIGENVAGFARMALDDCCADLEAAGYEVQPLMVPACAVDAPHRRDRIWILAHSGGQQHEGGCASLQWAQPTEFPTADATRELRDESGNAGQTGRNELANGCPATSDTPSQLAGHGNNDDVQEVRHGAESGASRSAVQPGYRWPVEPDVGRVAYGIPRRVDRLRGLGNAVVPIIPEIIGRAIVACARKNS